MWSCKRVKKGQRFDNKRQGKHVINLDIYSAANIDFDCSRYERSLTPDEVCGAAFNVR